MSSFWWNSRVTSFFPVAHWDTLESGISNAVFSFMSNCNRGPVMGDRDKKILMAAISQFRKNTFIKVKMLYITFLYYYYHLYIISFWTWLP